MRIRHLLMLPVVLAAVLLVPSAGIAQTSVPSLETRVMDLTNTLRYTEWQSLEKMLKAFEDTAATQLVVLLMPTLGGTDMDRFAADVFVTNQVGQNRKNGGVLLLVVKDRQNVRIEVGKALGSLLDDEVTGQIIAREMMPRIREENYYAGLVSGVDAIMSATAGEYQVDQEGKEVPLIVAGVIVVVALILLFVVRPRVRSRRTTFIGSVGHRYQSGWGSAGRPSQGPSSGKPGTPRGGGATGRW